MLTWSHPETEDPIEIDYEIKGDSYGDDDIFFTGIVQGEDGAYLDISQLFEVGGQKMTLGVFCQHALDEAYTRGKCRG